MLYEQRTDLPNALQRTLPIAAQDIYLKEYNKVWQEYEHTYHEVEALSPEEFAHRRAWGKVKQHFVKRYDGSWHSRSNNKS